MPDHEHESACTLPAPERRARESRYAAFLRAQRGRLLDLTLRIDIRGDPDVLADRVQAIADAERECCAPLTVRFEPQPGGGAVVLHAEGEPMAWTLAPLLDALRPSRPPRRQP